MKDIFKIIPVMLILITACSGGGSNPRVVTIADVGGSPDGVTAADSGYIYITDIDTGEIIQISPDGGITVVADIEGNPDGITAVTDSSGNDILYVSVTGTDDPETLSTDGYIAKIDVETGDETVFVNSNTLNNPTGIAADEDGNLYVADQDGGKIYKIPVGSDGAAGDLVELIDTSGYPAGVDLTEPHGLALLTNSDDSISLFITDEAADRNNIIKIDISDSTVISAEKITQPSTGGDTTDTTADEAKFDKPHGITANGNGAIFIADENNNRIQIITPGGNVVTFAGSGEAGDSDGDPEKAKFDRPRGMAIDKNGNVLVCDYGNGKVKKIID